MDQNIAPTKAYAQLQLSLSLSLSLRFSVSLFLCFLLFSSLLSYESSCFKEPGEVVIFSTVVTKIEKDELFLPQQQFSW